jgi:tRNA(Ile)-lysidine synthase
MSKHIEILGSIPRSVWVACSGGSDSMAVLDFVRRCHEVQVAFYHHGTLASQEALPVVHAYCAQHKLHLKVEHITGTKPPESSWEEWWRDSRLPFLQALPGEVITAHHLDDCVETYLFNCMHGKSHTIPYRNQNILRPFLTTPKHVFTSWCSRKGVPWHEDQSNKDVTYMRNLIRHEIVPQVMRVNPGLHKVVRRLVTQTFHNETRNNLHTGLMLTDAS